MPCRYSLAPTPTPPFYRLSSYRLTHACAPLVQQLRKRLAPPPGGALPSFASASQSGLGSGPGGVLLVEDSQLPPATATSDGYGGFGAAVAAGGGGGISPPEGGYLSGTEFMAADEVFKVRLGWHAKGAAGSRALQHRGEPLTHMLHLAPAPGGSRALLCMLR